MMVESLAARYEGDREAIVAAVDYCLPQLLEHGIIRETEAKSVTLESIRPGPKPALPKPVVNCFEDMRDLIQLDPVHEVSEAGWPHIRPDPAH